MASSHIHVCEARMGDELLGGALFVLLSTSPEPGSINIPIEYLLPRVHINYISTTQDSRSRGLGRNMLNVIIEWAKLNKAVLITANVKPENLPSQKMFIHAGFSKNPTPTEKGFITFFAKL